MTHEEMLEGLAEKLPFAIGDTVYLVTDPDQFERLVTGVVFKPAGISYEVCFSDLSATYHYEFELSHELDVKKKTDN